MPSRSTAPAARQHKGCRHPRRHHADNDRSRCHRHATCYRHRTHHADSDNNLASAAHTVRTSQHALHGGRLRAGTVHHTTWSNGIWRQHGRRRRHVRQRHAVWGRTGDGARGRAPTVSGHLRTQHPRCLADHQRRARRGGARSQLALLRLQCHGRRGEHHHTSPPDRWPTYDIQYGLGFIQQHTGRSGKHLSQRTLLFRHRCQLPGF